MDYFRQNQGKLRVACYQGLLDHVGKNASNKSKNFENKERLGHHFILPSTHIGVLDICINYIKMQWL